MTFLLQQNHCAVVTNEPLKEMFKNPSFSSTVIGLYDEGGYWFKFENIYKYSTQMFLS